MTKLIDPWEDREVSCLARATTGRCHAKLTVLGSCGAWPEPGRATSGFLLEYEGFRVVLDLGFGTVSRLLEYCPDGDVDAVIITHEHSDHCVDVNALFRLRYLTGRDKPRIPLYCTRGVVERIGPLEPDEQLETVFDVHELPNDYRIGPFELESFPLPHFVPNAGIRLTATDLIVAYTGDTGPDARLVQLGENADLFIMEATDRPGDASGKLMTARLAGKYAREAAANRLMITHFWPGNDRTRALRDAAQDFAGTILPATEGFVVEF